MSGKLDRARPIFVCCSERSEASDYREIESAGTAPRIVPCGHALRRKKPEKSKTNVCKYIENIIRLCYNVVITL